MNKSEEKIIKWFEQNYLDGDKIQDGQALHPAECINAILSALLSQKAEITEMIEEMPTIMDNFTFENERGQYLMKKYIINNLTAKAE